MVLGIVGIGVGINPAHHLTSTVVLRRSAEGEKVFTITQQRFDEASINHPDVTRELDLSIGWDTDQFEKHMATADVLVTWDLPTEGLAKAAPNLKWIHIIGAGVEHLAPMDWLPTEVVLTNNKGVHAKKAEKSVHIRDIGELKNVQSIS